jgi:hypothetical protein
LKLSTLAHYNGTNSFIVLYCPIRKGSVKTIETSFPSE